MNKAFLRLLTLTFMLLSLPACLVINGNDFSDAFRPSIQSSAMDGNYNEVEQFLKDGTDVNAADEEGDSALIIASRWGYLKIVVLLLESGANPNQLNTASESALGEAAIFNRKNDLQIVKQLVDSGADVDYVDNDGFTTLQLISYHQHHQGLEISQYLLAQGADSTILNQNGSDALMVALNWRDNRKGAFDKIMLLTEQLKDFSLLDYDGWSYMVYLCDEDAQAYDIELAKKLIALGVDMMQGEDPIETCELNDREQLAEYLKSI